MLIAEYLQSYRSFTARKPSAEEIAEKQIHHVWTFGLDETGEVNAKDAEIIPAIREIIKKGGQIIEIPHGRLLEDYVPVPFLESPEERRFYGAESIKRYAEQYRGKI